MLSIKALKPGNERYYLSLALEDYYRQGGEPPGFWVGSGATILGLTGEVQNEQLSKLFQGYTPDRHMKPLVQNAGRIDRQSGWDLTFSTPKTVSILWSAGNEKVRTEIESAQKNALQRTVAYMEQHLARSRVGKGGQDEVPARLVIATFPHSTSRALDPHCHFHCLVLNVGVGPDGRTRTILSHPFYQNKMLLGALFRAQLAYELVERLGLALARERTWFEAEGVPTALAREESTRRREVEAELGRLGLETATAAQYATLKTRRVRDVVPSREELFQKWKAIAKKHGLDEQAIKVLISRQRPPRPEDVLPLATSQALKELTKEHSHFSEADLLRALAESPSSLGVSVDALCSHAKHVLTWSPGIVSLGTRNGETRYTTKQMLALEKKLLQAVQQLQTTKFHILSDATVQAVRERERDFSAPPVIRKRRKNLSVMDAANIAARRLQRSRGAKRGKLSHEQASAVTHITQSPQRIALLSGYAGSAKTTTLEAVREAFEAEGYKVIGAALSGKAARELTNRAGIQSTTIRMRELELNPPLLRQLKHHGRQLRRAMRKWKTSKPERLIIDSKTVLVVDEASMVGTKDMLMLASAVAKGGGKLVLVGDPWQLPSIDAGGPFGSIAKCIPPVRLSNVVRQSDPADAEAVKFMPQGKAKQALAHYVEKNQVKLAETRSDLFAQLIDDWQKRDGVNKPQDNIICAALNREVDELNDLAQALRLNAGVIDPRQRISIRRRGARFEPPTTETFCVADRVTVTKKSRKYKVENGDTGTIVGLCRTPLFKKVSVQFDGEKSPRVLPLRKVSIRRGYAFTTHKLQGATADNVYVAMTGPMLNLQMAYVQLSRHRQSLLLYVPESLAEKDLLRTIERRNKAKAPPEPIDHQTGLRSVLSNLMAKDAGKDLAHDVIKNHVPAASDNGLTREEAERLLQSFARLGELVMCQGSRTLNDVIITNWRQAGGVTQPEQHQMFAQSESDRAALNRLAQEERKQVGLVSRTRFIDLGQCRIFVGDRLRFITVPKEHRIDQGTIATLLDIKGQSVQVKCLNSGETITIPTHVVHASLAYALPATDITTSMPKTAHVRLSDRFDDKELSFVYRSLHREKCRLYVTDEAAGEQVRSMLRPENPLDTTPFSLPPDCITPKHARKKVISHGQ
jgi:conjugative relaxase-like TrwC/TraI family protein